MLEACAIGWTRTFRRSRGPFVALPSFRSMVGSSRRGWDPFDPFRTNGNVRERERTVSFSLPGEPVPYQLFFYHDSTQSKSHDAALKEAQGNTDAHLKKPQDFTYQKMQERNSGVPKKDYANANMQPGHIILSTVWARGGRICVQRRGGTLR